MLAFHGAHQDPEAFRRTFDFARVWERLSPPPQSVRQLQDQFILVYPYGWSPGSARGVRVELQAAPFTPPPPIDTSVLPAAEPVTDAVTQTLSRDAQVVDAATRAARNLPVPVVRSAEWNCGWVPTVHPQDDVAFVDALLAEIEARLLAQLDGMEVNGQPVTRVVDPARVFLFGYAEGGMLCHRLVREMPNRFAAVFAISASCGGRLHRGVPGPPFVAGPTGLQAISVYSWNGTDDRVVPPGPDTAAAFMVDEVGPEALQKLVRPTRGGHVNVPPQAAFQLVHTHLSLRTTSLTYGAANNVPFVAPVTDPTVPLPLRYQSGGPLCTRYAWSTLLGVPPLDDNPVVIEHRDPNLVHDALFDVPSDDWPLTLFDIWDFFAGHPRV